MRGLDVTTMAFVHSMDRASRRCEHIAASEKILGYTDNWEVYHEMGEEIKALSSWIISYATSLESS